MHRRFCENCRHFVRENGESTGECRIRSVPQGAFPRRNAREDCGEWQDGKLLPEQHERRELIRQFALAIVQQQTDLKAFYPGDVWATAKRFADAEGW